MRSLSIDTFGRHGDVTVIPLIGRMSDTGNDYPQLELHALDNFACDELTERRYVRYFYAPA